VSDEFESKGTKTSSSSYILSKEKFKKNSAFGSFFPYFCLTLRGKKIQQ